MEKMFEELDYVPTSMGELILRRRKIAMLDNEIVYEILLAGDFLMSSMFHTVEDALADLGVAACPSGPLDVVVGGLGLGYTAVAALAHERVRSLIVVEFHEPVLRWHRSEMVPLGKPLCSDPRSRLLQGDFFDLAAKPGTGFDPERPGRKFHAILLDIDHTPRHWLDPQHASFYSDKGLSALRRHLHPDGVFAMWSDDAPDEEFCVILGNAFDRVDAHTVRFPNPIRGGESSSTVYVALAGEPGDR